MLSIRLLRRAAAAALFLLALPVLAETITFGIVGAEKQETLAAGWRPVLDALEQRTGLTVKAFYGKDYQSVIDGMNRGEIQFASFGNRSAIDVVKQGHAEVFAQWVNAKGEKGYNAHLIALKSRRWKDFDDVLKDAGKLRFAFGDLKSTSGTLVPSYYLFGARKLKPDKVFASVSHGNHEVNIEAVLEGKVDVATNNNEILSRLAANEPKKYAKLKNLWTSPLIPLDPMLWRKDLSAETKAKLRKFFLDYGKRPEERESMAKHLGLSGFAASDDNQLLPIRQLELYRQRQALETSELSIQDQFRRMVEIDSELAELGEQVRKLAAGRK